MIVAFPDKSEQKLWTESDGSFIVKGVSKAPVSLRAIFDGYLFDEVIIDKVEPNMKLAPILPSLYKLSGKVDRAGFDQEINIRIRDIVNDALDIISVTDGGKFATSMPPGEYSISVEVSDPEQAKIGFAPLELKAILIDSPVSGLNFHAIKADIEGHVQCLGKFQI